MPSSRAARGGPHPVTYWSDFDDEALFRPFPCGGPHLPIISAHTHRSPSPMRRLRVSDCCCAPPCVRRQRAQKRRMGLRSRTGSTNTRRRSDQRDKARTCAWAWSFKTDNLVQARFKMQSSPSLNTGGTRRRVPDVTYRARSGSGSCVDWRMDGKARRIGPRQG